MCFGFDSVMLHDDSGNEGEAGEVEGGQILRNAVTPRQFDCAVRVDKAQQLTLIVVLLLVRRREV